MRSNYEMRLYLRKRRKRLVRTGSMILKTSDAFLRIRILPAPYLPPKASIDARIGIARVGHTPCLFDKG